MKKSGVKKKLKKQIVDKEFKSPNIENDRDNLIVFTQEDQHAGQKHLDDDHDHFQLHSPINNQGIQKNQSQPLPVDGKTIPKFSNFSEIKMKEDFSPNMNRQSELGINENQNLLNRNQPKENSARTDSQTTDFKFKTTNQNIKVGSLLMQKQLFHENGDDKKINIDQDDQQDDVDFFRPKQEISDKDLFDGEHDALQLLAECCKYVARLCKRSIRCLNTCFNRADQKVSELCKCSEENKFKTGSRFAFIVFFFLAIFAIYVGLTSNSSTLVSPDGFDPLKKYVANHLIVGAFIFTGYGIIFLQLKSYVVMIALFFFQAVPAIFIFLTQAYKAYVSNGPIAIAQPDFVIALYVLLLYFFWLAAYIIQDDIKEAFSEKAQIVFLMCWCIFPGAMIAGFAVYSASTTWDLNPDWGYKLLNIIAAPYILCLCLGWVYLHFRYLEPLMKRLTQSGEEVQNDININSSHFDNESNMHSIQKQLQNFSDLTKSAPLTQSVMFGKKKKVSFFRIYFQNYVIIFSSCVMGGSMITLTILSILNISTALAQGYSKLLNPKSFYLSVFMALFVPAFTLIGTGLIYANARDKTKLILVPILGALIPMLFTMPFSNVLDKFRDYRPLKPFFTFGPSLVALYWITLVLLRINYWRFAMFLNSYLCLFFIIPIIYIVPLRNVSTYYDDDQIAYYFELILIILGISLVISFFLLDLIITVIKNWIAHSRRHQQRRKSIYKNQGGQEEEEEEDEFTKTERFELSNIFKYDLENFGLWGNSFGYIITFTILIFMYYNGPQWVSKNQYGILIGLQIVIIFLFVYCLIILMMKIIPEQKKEDESFSEKLASLVTNKHERDIYIDRQRKVKRTILHIGIIDSPIICIILGFYFKNDDQIRTNFLVIGIGNVIVSLIFVLMYEVKQKFDDYSKTAIPALVVFLWLFLYMPFSGIIPSSLIYLSVDKEELVDYERMVIAVTALLLMFGIALVTSITHLFFKRRDFEKKFKFIANKVIKKLAKNHIKSDYNVINLAYQGYISMGEEKCSQQWKDESGEKQVFWTNISKYDPNMAFSKLIIDFDTWEKVKKKKIKTYWWDNLFMSILFLICCCYRDIFDQKNTKISPEEQSHLLDDPDGLGEDDEMMMQRAQDDLHAENVKQIQENEEEAEEEPHSWLKDYLLNVHKSYFDARIIEPLRRYDLPQNLQISKPWTQSFLTNVFKLFAQGSKTKFDMPWIDYIMFKQMLIMSGLVPSRDITDESIDKIYGKCTAYERVANTQPITEDRFLSVLQEIAILKYPYDPAEDQIGKLIKFWMFPYLLWHLIPMHGLYPHEWDYVLFLLKYYGMKDTYDSVMKADIFFRRNLEKELGILPLDAQNLNPDIDQNQEKERWTLKRILECICNFFLTFEENIIYFMKSHCLLEKDQRNEGIDEVELESKMIKDTILKTKPLLNKRKKIFKHPESPDWPQIVDLVLVEFIDQEKEWIQKKDDEFKYMRLKLNVTNTLVIFLNILEIYALGSLTFRPQVPWGLNEKTLNVLNIFNTELPSGIYVTMFQIAFALVIVYLIIAYRTVLRIRNLTYGQSESKKTSKLLSLDLFYIIVIQIIQQLFFFFMLKIFIDTFSCDYSVVPKTLYQDIKMVCFKGVYYNYFGIAVAGMLMMYPMGTFLYANIQYQNKALDFKFDPTYKVIEGNIKFLVAGAAAFFAHEAVVLYQLIISSLLLFGFGILTRKMKPCLVKKVNPLQMGGYLLAGWMNASGIVVMLTKNAFIGWLCLIIGAFMILMVSLGFFKILHDKQKDMKRSKKKKGVFQSDEGLEEGSDAPESSDEDEEEGKKKDTQEESLEFRIWKALNEFKQKKEMMGEWPEEIYKPLLPEAVDDQQGDKLNVIELESNVGGGQKDQNVNSQLLQEKDQPKTGQQSQQQQQQQTGSNK